ncbi:MAG: hypothetical protein ACLFQ6_06885 [Candidatus Sumerlaeia bacterium]
MIRDYAEFEWLIQHELALAKRYRRYLSLIFIRSGQAPHHMAENIQRFLRDCDAIYPLDDEFIFLLLSDTNKSGASKLVDRIRDTWALHETFIGVATFPSDNVNFRNFPALAANRLRMQEEQASSTGIYNPEMA